MRLKNNNNRMFIITVALAMGFMAACTEHGGDEPIVVVMKADLDLDEVPNNVDNCPGDNNPDQLDTDGDGMGDACDNDVDGDGVLNPADNCPDNFNPDQANLDKVLADSGNVTVVADLFGDVCDNDDDGDVVCDPWLGVDGWEEFHPGQGETCQGEDNCPDVANADQANLDKDFEGDVCDNDVDGDGDLNGADNCPLVTNADQANLDRDDWGDACDTDDDNDSFCDEAAPVSMPRNAPAMPLCEGEDNCPRFKNAGQEDMDEDGMGDVCDDDCDGDLYPEASPWDFPNLSCFVYCNPEGPGTECDDANTCTTDTCNGQGVCEYVFTQSETCECVLDSDCEPTDACVTEMACVENTCVETGWKVLTDGDNCTIDTCDPSTGVVTHVEKDCGGDLCGGGLSCNRMTGECSTPVPQIPINDSNACTTDACDPETGVVTHVAIVCDDGNACNGTETCNPASGCVAGTPLTCDDGSVCTIDSCSANTCQHVAVTTNDNNMCTTDTCDPEMGVQHTAVVCNDVNSNTTDTCDPATGCVHTPTGNCTVNADCNDSNPLTYDTCVALVCQHVEGVRVQVSSTDTSETWQVNFYYNGTTISGNLPFDGTLPKTLACSWGADIAVNRPSTNLFLDCNPGFPSKSTLTVMVNGVTKANDFQVRSQACDGAPPGNLWLSDESGDNDLGCPAAP